MSYNTNILYIIALLLLFIFFLYNGSSNLESWMNFKKKKLCYNCNDILIDQKDIQYYMMVWTLHTKLL
jgi:hypothetical protein